MKPFLSEISFAMVSDLLAKKAAKTPHKLNFLHKKSICPFKASLFRKNLILALKPF